ncbi:hypothetical protein V6N11_032293 [Hibiscus sabdariffa]|uniref:Uncharacterized protein n=1 Tax=Hibiscus sabdariffa TaxID=183260 RepID=A0ABR2T0I9_9ROSI
MILLVCRNEFCLLKRKEGERNHGAGFELGVCGLKKIIWNGIVSHVGSTCHRSQYGGGRSIIQIFCFVCAFLRRVVLASTMVIGF